MPKWWVKPEQDSARFYRGSSMAGTFCPGDYLTVAPVSLADVHPGDVVVYRGPNHRDGSGDLVHRIVARRTEGLVARGDSNACADAVLVTSGNLVGRVTHVERGGRSWPVQGGWRGLLRARVLHVRRRLSRYAWRWAVRLGHWPYARLRSGSLVRRLWRPAVIRLRLSTEDGPLVKYVCDGRTVATWWPEHHRFDCQKPYDLVIPHPRGTWKPGSPT